VTPPPPPLQFLLVFFFRLRIPDFPLFFLPRYPFPFFLSLLQQLFSDLAGLFKLWGWQQPCLYCRRVLTFFRSGTFFSHVPPRPVKYLFRRVCPTVQLLGLWVCMFLLSFFFPTFPLVRIGIDLKPPRLLKLPTASFSLILPSHMAHLISMSLVFFQTLQAFRVFSELNGPPLFFHVNFWRFS